MSVSLPNNALVTLLLTSVATATIIRVPQDQPTIQEGIDAAIDRDTVLVDTGRYVENINFNGKNIMVGSLFLTTLDTYYISQTVIDGDSNGTVVAFEGGEDSTAVLSGFTITNGLGSHGWEYLWGGGIYVQNSSPSLVHVEVTGNTAIEGGGICCYNSNPGFTNLTVVGNRAENGGGIWCYNSTPKLVKATFSLNTAKYRGGAIYCDESSAPTLVNTILWNDLPQEVYFGETGKSNSITIAYSDIHGGQEAIMTNNNGTVSWLEGNIEDDPLFADAGNRDFNLQEGSPCIDAGTAFFVWEGDTLVNLPETAYEGNAPDIGAFESPYSVAIDKEDAFPMEYAVEQNYPNPFNPTTTIEFSLPRSGLVTLTVFDLQGRVVETILNEQMATGQHKVLWNAVNVSSGIYFIRMQGGDFRQVRKVMVLR